MLATDIVKALMEKQNVKTNDFARRIGQSPATTCNRLTQKNISIDKLQEMLRVLDYKILIVPSDRRVREDEYEVSVSDKKPKIDLDALLGITKEEA